MKSKNKRLIAYSASAVCLLQIHSEVNAQAVYVDIDPDTILSEHYDMFILDVDGDGHNDFDFYNLSYMHYAESSGDHNHFRQRIFAGVRYFGDTEFNGIVGSIGLDWSYSAGTYNIYFVSNLPPAYLVSQEVEFNPWVVQIMAWRDYVPGVLSTGDTLFDAATEQRGQWLDDVEDRYMGIKFRAGDDSTHYGWLRCTVKDDGSSGFQLIIKDYVYELTPNAPIVAGDTIGGLPAPEDTTSTDTTIIDTTVLIANQKNARFSIYSFGKTIYINAQSVEQSYQITVCDLQGKKITKKVSNLKHTELVMDVPPGIYMVRIIDEKNTLNKKVYLE